MEIRVNGEPHVVTEGQTVRGLLESLGLGEVRVAVEVNRNVVARARHAEVVLSSGDIIEIVHFVGGG